MNNHVILKGVDVEVMKVRPSFVDTLFPVPQGGTSTRGRAVIIIIYYSNQMSVKHRHLHTYHAR